MKKEYKKSRYYNCDDFAKKFKTRPYSKENKKKINNHLRQLIHSGDHIDEEYLEEMEEINDVK